MANAYFFTGAPKSKKYGDRTAPVSAVIVDGAKDKDAAKAIAQKHMGNVTVSGGNAFANVNKAREVADYKTKLYGISYTVLDLNFQRELAVFVGMYA